MSRGRAEEQPGTQYIRVQVLVLTLLTVSKGLQRGVRVDVSAAFWEIRGYRAVLIVGGMRQVRDIVEECYWLSVVPEIWGQPLQKSTSKA